MKSVREFADKGGPVLGICNGFQILTEAGLLPGAMLRNRGLKFICEHVHLRVDATDTPFTSLCKLGDVLRLPINHGEGNYYAAPEEAMESPAVMLQWARVALECAMKARAVKAAKAPKVRKAQKTPAVKTAKPVKTAKAKTAKA